MDDHIVTSLDLDSSQKVTLFKQNMTDNLENQNVFLLQSQHDISKKAERAREGGGGWKNSVLIGSDTKTCYITGKHPNNRRK